MTLQNKGGRQIGRTLFLDLNENNFLIVTNQKPAKNRLFTSQFFPFIELHTPKRSRTY